MHDAEWIQLDDIYMAVWTEDISNGAATAEKISSIGASTYKVLLYNGSSVVWGFASGSVIKYTVLNAKTSIFNNFTSTYQNAGNIGTITKLNGASTLEITFYGRIYAGFVTSDGV